MSVLWSLLGFVMVIGILVTIHEWGHFQTARWFNIKVIRFSIGFGRPIWRRRLGETDLQVSMIPLGGYVKFADEADGPVAEQDLPRAFNRQSVYKRFAVVAAGPVINLLFAWLVFSAIYLIGVTALKPIFGAAPPGTVLAEALPQNGQAWLVTEIEGKSVDNWLMVRESILKALVEDRTELTLRLENLNARELDRSMKLPLSGLSLDDRNQAWLSELGFRPVDIPLPAVVGKVSDDSPASVAGIQEGDEILKMDENPVNEWQDVVEWVRGHPDQTVSIMIAREREILYKVVHLSHKADADGQTTGLLGVAVMASSDLMEPYLSTSRYGVVDALRLGAEKSWDLTIMTLTMLKKMVMGEASLSNLSGPVSIAHFSGQALESGLISFLGLLGLLSLSLGILNLLPVPVLDGGHLVYYIIEMIKGSPVSESAMLVGQKIGLLLILGLTILAITNDILRITHG